MGRVSCIDRIDLPIFGGWLKWGFICILSEGKGSKTPIHDFDKNRFGFRVFPTMRFPRRIPDDWRNLVKLPRMFQKATLTGLSRTCG